MKRMINVTDENMALELKECGFNYMESYLNSDEKVFVFQESKELYKLLNDKKRFSKRHWHYNQNNKLLF